MFYLFISNNNLSITYQALDKEREYEKRLEYEQSLKEQKEDEEMEKQYLCEERKKVN